MSEPVVNLGSVPMATSGRPPWLNDALAYAIANGYVHGHEALSELQALDWLPPTDDALENRGDDILDAPGSDL